MKHIGKIAAIILAALMVITSIPVMQTFAEEDAVLNAPEQVLQNEQEHTDVQEETLPEEIVEDVRPEEEKKIVDEAEEQTGAAPEEKTDEEKVKDSAEEETKAQEVPAPQMKTSMLMAPMLGATVDKFAYNQSVVNFIKEDGTEFGMYRAQEGTTCELDGDNVVIHYVPNKTETYTSLAWGSIEDETFVKAYEIQGGAYDITLPKSYCGYAHPVVPLKADGVTTTSAQYYLAIPSADKLPEVKPKVNPFAYEGDQINAIDKDGNQFSMFTPQEGTTCELDGDNVVIHYVPKNITTYVGIHWGAISDDPLTKMYELQNGAYDITLPKSYCGYAYPIAPLKADGKTTTKQYYLAIPSADKLPEAKPKVKPFEYDGDEVNAIQADGTAFKMFAPQEGTTCELDGDNVVIHYVPKNTTTYVGIHWGAISDDPLTKMYELQNGAYDITLPKSYCGYAYPIAPLKSDGTTAGTQYYLAIPKLTHDTYEVTKELEVINNIKMFSPVSAFLGMNGTEGSKDYVVDLVLTMGSTSYDKVFVGTKEAAEKAEKVIDAVDGTTFTIPVNDLLNKKVTLAFHSKNNNNWYDRGMTINEEAATITFDPVEEGGGGGDTPGGGGGSGGGDTPGGGSTVVVDNTTGLPDGIYTPDRFSFSGGTGKAILSCTQVRVSGGQAFATISVDSPNYSYFKANGTTYMCAHGAGTSYAEIPVQLNQNNTIIGMTTAMSTAHEVAYTIFIYIKGADAKGSIDALKANDKLDTEAPEIAGLKLVGEVKIENAKYFKMFEYEDDIHLVEVDMTTDTKAKKEAEEKGKDAASSEKTEQTEEKAAVVAEDGEEAVVETVADAQTKLYKGNVVKYLLVPEDTEIPAGLDKEIIVIYTPVKGVYAGSEKIEEIMTELGAEKLITSKPELSKSDETDEKNSVKAVGEYDDLDIKALVKSKTEVLLLPSKVLDTQKDKAELEDLCADMATLKLSVIVDRSQDEKDAKAKAEWLKIYGLLFGTEKKADELIAEILK